MFFSIERGPLLGSIRTGSCGHKCRVVPNVAFLQVSFMIIVTVIFSSQVRTRMRSATEE